MVSKDLLQPVTCCVGFDLSRDTVPQADSAWEERMKMRVKLRSEILGDQNMIILYMSEQ